MTLKVTLTRSTIGRPKNQRKVVEALGLKKMNQTVEHKDNAAIRGMINKVSHLVTVEEKCQLLLKELEEDPRILSATHVEKSELLEKELAIFNFDHAL